MAFGFYHQRTDAARLVVLSVWRRLLARLNVVLMYRLRAVQSRSSLHLMIYVDRFICRRRRAPCKLARQLFMRVKPRI